MDIFEAKIQVAKLKLMIAFTKCLQHHEPQQTKKNLNSNRTHTKSSLPAFRNYGDWTILKE